MFERNRRGVTFGWGVVFSDQTVENLMANDPGLGQDHRRRIRPLGRYRRPYPRARRSARRATASSASAASGCSKSCRTGRASSASSSISRPSAIPPIPKWRDYDLVIAADGANSRFRDAYADAFGVDIDERANKFVWLGTSKVFDAFTFAFEETEPGWIWAHAYRFAPDCSTFIVECSEETWRGLGFDPMDQAESDRALREGSSPNISTATRCCPTPRICAGSAAWLNFRRINCERWSTAI